MDLDDGKETCPCCGRRMDPRQVQRHLKDVRERQAAELRLQYGGGVGAGNDETQGNTHPVVAAAGEQIDVPAAAGGHEDMHVDDDIGMDNPETEEPVVEAPPNDAGLATPNAGADAPLRPALGLRRNPPVTIEDWPDVEANPGLLGDEDEDEDELEGDEPIDGPDRDPPYVEHNIPPGLDPIDEPRLADDDIREILQRHLGDLAAQQWADDRILSKRDRNTLRMLAARLRTHFSRDTWDELRRGVCESLDIPSEFIAWRRLRLLAELESSAYDCCINSCCCFLGKYQDLNECPFCHEARYNARGNARRLYRYTPLIPQLRALFQDKEMAKKLGYRVQAEGRFDPEVVEDVFDGANYRTLRQTLLRPDSDYCFFANPQDLGFETTWRT
ncbi:hypothetical protein FRC08_013646 [Ceratobasidium sp. 394]|nr:hypothetical protein FRC08_013646 [Ceratobasidium sp. 394]